MRADEHGVELDALRAERLEHELVRPSNAACGKLARAEAVLVGDHHELEAALCAWRKRREHARHEADLLEAVDLLVGRLLDQRAVAIDEQHACVMRAHRKCSAAGGRSARACRR